MAIPRLIIASLLVLVSCVAFALPGVQAHESNFNAIQGNKLLNRFSMHSFIDRVSVTQLQAGITVLNKFTAQAKKCVADNTAALDETNQRLSEIINPPMKTSAVSAEQKYLNNKKIDISNQLSECRLFVMRSDELTASLSIKLRNMIKMELLYAGPTFLDNANHISQGLSNFYLSLDFSPFYQSSGIYLFNPVETIWLVLIMAFGIIITLKLKSLLSAAMQDSNKRYFLPHFTSTVQAVLHRYLVFFIPVFLFALFVSAISSSMKELPNLALISYALVVYLLIFMLIDLYFIPPKPAKGFTKLPAHLAQTLASRLKLLISLCLCAYVVYVAFNALVPDLLIDLFTTLFITAITINLIAIIWLINYLPSIHHHTGLRFFISLVLCIVLFTILVAEWLGYHLLAIYLLQSIAFTVVLLFAIKLLLQIITVSLNSLTGTEQNWQQNFRKVFGLKTAEKLAELLWLRIFLHIIVWFVFFLLLLKIWGVGQTAFHMLANALIYGFHIGGVNVIPSHIALGTLSFIFLAGCTRIIRSYIVRHAEMQLDKGNRESVAAIAGYIGFAIAIIIGLLIAGVSFSGLAIIAGALSVGIGFGLRDIVNNFVSGLVLLIERPIKPGDRIIVGETEGYVRKISIRATNIITLQRSDVIVPNSDLISKQVTNYMLYDTTFKISNSVGIAYGSDTKRAQKLLLEIAHNHPQIITNRLGYEPQVYFRKFGEHSLEFEMICLIKDAELKSIVQSEINFSIDKIFQEHNIEIAFPQREITIRNWPKEATNEQSQT